MRSQIQPQFLKQTDQNVTHRGRIEGENSKGCG